MADLRGPWLLAVVAIPLAFALVTFLRMPFDRLRRLTIAGSGATLAVSLMLLLEFRLRRVPSLLDPLDPMRRLFGQPLFQLDELSVYLLPFAALISTAALLVAPRADKNPGTLRRMLEAEALVLATFMAHDELAVAILWGLGMIPAFQELRNSGPGFQRPLRVFSIYMGLSTALFIGGALALRAEGLSGLNARPWGTSLILVAVLIRKGIAPFHSWMPEFFEHVPLGVVVLFSAPQVGAYAAIRFVAPYAPDAVLRVIGYSALLTAVYGAFLALVQKDARRAFAFIFMSESAIVMAGLECASEVGLTGGLCLWMSCGLSLAGFGMALWVLEARRGVLSLVTYQGGYDRMPLLASSFLLLGLASIGFPGTLGFLGEELLIEGAVAEFPRVGVAAIVATAVNGISILNMYFVLFCGARSQTYRDQWLRRRELTGFVALVIVVILGGVFPRAFVSSRRTAATQILEARRESAVRPAPKEAPKKGGLRRVSERPSGPP